ncbi:arginine permease [Trypanosoma cruzi]|uniref:Arginine permease n=1 Tax=Trypanosoma cruzi TaxID=5693 RepID=A0A2V2VJ80_TRYCR|nr:arginine permease [Trypanosoma cruzi]
MDLEAENFVMMSPCSSRANGAIEGLSIFMFSYLCHMNCFSIFGEMRKPSARRMTLHTACSMSLCCIAYIVAGFFGYADFGDEVTDTVLVFYDVRRDVLMAIAYAGIVLKLCVGFALCMQPARDCCYYIIGWDVATIPAWRNCLFCGVMALCALLLGLFIPVLNTVFGLLGSFCGGTLGFCLPALYRMYCGNWSLGTVGIVNYVCTYLLLMAGVVAVSLAQGPACMVCSVMCHRAGEQEGRRACFIQPFASWRCHVRLSASSAES